MVVVTVDAQFIFDLEQSAVEANSGLLWRGLGAPPWPGISGASESSSGWVYKGKVKYSWCQEIIRPDWMPDGRVEEETAQSLPRVGGVGARSQSQGILLGLPQMFPKDKFKDLIFQPQRVSRLVSDPFNAA